MWTFLHRAWRFFSIGFIVGLVISLFALVDTDDLLLALGVGAISGAVLTVVILWLERRFPDEQEQPAE